MGSTEYETRYDGKAGEFERLEEGEEPEDILFEKRTERAHLPARSIEGWDIIVTGVHEEASDDQVMEAFEPFGNIRNLHLNLDRQTGYAKGYALIDFEKRSEAEDAIKNMDGADLLGRKLKVDWAFIQPPKSRR